MQFLAGPVPKRRKTDRYVKGTNTSNPLPGTRFLGRVWQPDPCPSWRILGWELWRWDRVEGRWRCKILILVLQHPELVYQFEVECPDTHLSQSSHGWKPAARPWQEMKQLPALHLESLGWIAPFRHNFGMHTLCGRESPLFTLFDVAGPLCNPLDVSIHYSKISYCNIDWFVQTCDWTLKPMFNWL